MTMEWRTIPVQMNGGVDQKTDSKQVVPGRWLTLQNVEMLKSGRFKKRTGFSTQGVTTANASAYATVNGVKHDVPLTTDSRIALGMGKSCGLFSRNPVATRTDDGRIYAAYNSDDGSVTTFTLKTRQLGSDVYPVGDSTSFTGLLSQYSLLRGSAGGNSPIFLIHKVTAGITGDLVITNQTGAVLLTVASGISLVAGRLSNVVGTGNFIYFAYAPNGGNITVCRYNFLTGTVDKTATLVDVTAVPYINTGGGNVYVGYGNTSVQYDAALTYVTGHSFVSTIISISTDGSTLVKSALVAGVYTYSQYNFSGSLQKSWQVGDLAVTSASFFQDALELQGRQFVSSIDQESSMLLLSLTQEELAAHYGTCRGVTRLSTSSIAVKKLVDVGGYFDIVIHDVSLMSASHAVVFNRDICYVSGNVRVRESDVNSSIMGICTSPKISNTFNGAAAGSNIYTAGSYQYTAIYTRVTAAGNRVRSVPATSNSFTVTAGDLNIPRSIYVYSRMTDVYVDENTNIEVYLTDPNGTVFVRKAAVRKAAFVTVFLDPSVGGGINLYTTGGVLEDLPSPAVLGGIQTIKNRLWANSAELSQAIFTDQTTPGEVALFNEAFTLRLPDIDGPGVMASEMDGKIIVFQDTCMSATFGEGPDQTGANNFPDLQVLNTDVGCIAPKSIQVVDDGLMFASRKGIWLLNRSFGFDYIGAPVEDFALSVTTAYLPSAKDQVLFAAGNTLLVWDCFHKLWSLHVLSGIANISWIDVMNGTAVLLNDGQTYTQNSNLDAGNTYSITAKTGWLSLSGLEGFERIRRIMFLCDQVTASTITVTLRYNFISTVAETFTINTATIVDTGNNVQWIMRPKIQKCESIQIEIASTGSFDLSGFSIEAGGKSGLFRLNSTKKIQGV